MAACSSMRLLVVAGYRRNSNGSAVAGSASGLGHALARLMSVTVAAGSVSVGGCTCLRLCAPASEEEVLPELAAQLLVGSFGDGVAKRNELRQQIQGPWAMIFGVCIPS